MKKYTLFFGIDVSKSVLDIVGINNKDEVIVKHSIIVNNKKSIQKNFRGINRKYKDTKYVVAFENTGVYSSLLAQVFSEMEIDYCQIPSLEIKNSMGITRGKNDKIDSLKIAQYLISHQYKLKLSTFTELNIMELRLLHTQREKILKSLKQFTSNKETYAFLPKKIQKELRSTSLNIEKNLKRNLKIVEQKITQIVDSEISLKRQFDLVKSIPGIGTQTAVYLLIVTKGFTAFENAKQLACYAGVAPFPFQSGSSIRGNNKVSHLADKKLKSLLNMCALSAKKWDPDLKLYFERKVDEGKNKMLVMNNLRNKLLTRIFAVIRRDQPYVNIKKYAA